MTVRYLEISICSTPLAFSSSSWQGTRKYFVRKNNIGSLIIGGKRQRCLGFTLFLVPRKNLSPVRDSGAGEFGSITNEAAWSHLGGAISNTQCYFPSGRFAGNCAACLSICPCWSSLHADQLLWKQNSSSLTVCLPSSPFLLHVSEMKFRF